MTLSPDKKIAGVLVPLFALRMADDLGIGDLNALRQFVDWAAGVGFQLVQLLPTNEVGGDNSPYNAISSIAIEPTTLHLGPGSPVDLTDADFAAATREVDLAQLRRGRVKYARVRRLKRTLLEKAFARFREGREMSDRAKEFAQFCAREKSWVDDYAFFRALMELNHNREAWDQWPEAQQSCLCAREWLRNQPEMKQKEFAEREIFFRYVQWIADEQWTAIKRHADECGVALMGDIPFGVSYYSADVFTRPDEFRLDWSGGAPPERYFKDDAFTQKWGQNWGIPLYRWEVMRSKNFDWWRQRVRGVGRSFHVFRIDHVLGFYRIYAFPWRPNRNGEFLPLSWPEMLGRTGGHGPHFAPRDDSHWENCEANRRDGEEYLRAVLDEASGIRVVGEDLGTVPDYVRPSLRALEVAGFKIPQWENHLDGRSISGSEYERVSVATYATHDHKPLRAVWREAYGEVNEAAAQARDELAKIAEFTGKAPPNEQSDYDRDFYWPALETLFACESWMVIVMITDLLAREERFNVPGTANAGNWTRRLPKTIDYLKSSRSVKRRMELIRATLQKTGRAQ